MKKISESISKRWWEKKNWIFDFQLNVFIVGWLENEIFPFFSSSDYYDPPQISWEFVSKLYNSVEIDNDTIVFVYAHCQKQC